MLVFYHKSTGEIERYPDGIEDAGLDEDWRDVIDKVDENWGDYLRLERMRSHEGFKVMEDFVETIGHIPTHNKFIDVLSRKKPFFNFSNLLGYYPDLRQQWFLFKAQRYIEHVKRQIDAFNTMQEYLGK